jgi:hypothetical protein
MNYLQNMPMFYENRDESTKGEVTSVTRLVLIKNVNVSAILFFVCLSQKEDTKGRNLKCL